MAKFKHEACEPSEPFTCFPRPKIINWHNFAAHHAKDLECDFFKFLGGADAFKFGERFFGPSLTIPDQSLPLKVLLERYTVGGEVELFPGVYSEDVPPFEYMSTIERVEYLFDMKQNNAKKLAYMKAMKEQEASADDEPEPKAVAGESS